MRSSGSPRLHARAAPSWRLGSRRAHGHRSRGRCRRASLRRGDRAARPHRIRVELARAHLSLRRMATPGAAAVASPRTAPHRARDVHEDGSRGARAARRARAAGHGRARAKRSDDTRDDLTAQEAQIARLARDGLSDPEIGTRLSIGSRTVEHHLHKAFTTLGISSRNQLGRAVPAGPSAACRRRRMGRPARGRAWHGGGYGVSTLVAR